MKTYEGVKMTNKNAMHNISVHVLKKLMDQQPNICLIDVREIAEWQTIRIPGAVHIPKDTLAAKIAELMLDKNHAIYLHCQGGVRSLTAANGLKALGYTNLYSIDGGIGEWAMFGYPVEC
jgi:rhodanese-related sulfurtransferase